MILEIADWKFAIDIDTTMDYSAQEAMEHCTCAYCRNFYTAVDDDYPKFRSFLAQFGLNIEAPDELMPYDDENQVIYMASYVVSGRILQQGRPLECAGVPVGFRQGAAVNSQCPEPCFTVEAGMFALPWILDEPLKEVRSPANFPAFLKKMWNKLLGRAEDTMKS